jgi:hypothetical protein
MSVLFNGSLVPEGSGLIAIKAEALNSHREIFSERSLGREKER